MSYPRRRLRATLFFVTTIQQPVTVHQEGRLDNGEQLYHRVHQGRPDHFDALHLLGDFIKS